jgi:hypothetical protein
MLILKHLLGQMDATAACFVSIANKSAAARQRSLESKNASTELAARDRSGSLPKPYAGQLYVKANEKVEAHSASG